MEIAKPNISSRIRTARPEDIGAINRIYNHAVLHTTATFHIEPLSLREQSDWFQKHSKSGTAVFVSELEDGKVVGWASLSPWSPKEAYSKTLEVSVYIDPEHHREGHGLALMSKIVDHAKTSGVRVITSRIADGNPPSIALHERLGFKLVGVMTGVGEKFGRTLDIHLFQLNL